MPLFRKKPVVIEAFQMTTAMGKTPEDWPAWAQKAWRSKDIRAPKRQEFAPEVAVVIETREGQMAADFGDWIIQGVKGELCPCKPDIFAATYEPA